jgi:uncharacterized linocin/CFP29 family protein
MPLLDNYVPSLSFPASGGVLNSLPGGGALPDANWVRLRQPFLDRFGRTCVTIRDLRGGMTRNDSRGGEPKPLLRTYLANDLRNQGYVLPIVNAATLTKEAWIEVDRQVVRAARQNLRAAADLEASSSYGGFNAMGRMTLEYQAVSDAGEAVVDMDARTDARTDTPLVILRSLPLPITHSDFGYSAREVEVSRSGNLPFDTTMAEMAARRVAESVEDQVIGNVTGVTYGTQTAGTGTQTGTSTVYGYRNFPQRLTKTNFTAPTGGGWTPETTFNEVLSAMQSLLNQYFTGPFRLYFSLDWFQYMNRQFSVAGGNNAGETLLSMLNKVPNLMGVELLERLTATFTLLIVQMAPNVAQMVNGMDVTTIAWEEKGGLDLRWKVLAIKVPRLRSDYNSRTGILHGTTS